MKKPADDLPLLLISYKHPRKRKLVYSYSYTEKVTREIVVDKDAYFLYGISVLPDHTIYQHVLRARR